ncbi:branched-chain amino acid ABC transporter [Ammoniphilus oxalaticus]|uniref:Branched-chain amino acid ABC transporter n=1 Tax=Ammoniphilus oxalaticus TaxID=66863 RepID=A0A419SLM2_9BACL|nr:AzlD domain-containing protein [Ammoniphilus oxalaticus]RKD24983.1 branched-chain amino acid ABC transporter [Ammoniphilus oxalaticus]
MEVRGEILFIILGAALVTFIPRALPLVVLSRIQIPEWGMRWLKYVPISVMAALVGQELLLNDGQFTPISQNMELWAALPTFIVAILTRSLLGAVLVGILSLMALRFLF